MDATHIYPIRVVHPAGHDWAYAIHAWNAHTRSFEPVGKAHTGPMAFRDAYVARQQMIEELQQETMEAQP